VRGTAVLRGLDGERDLDLEDDLPLRHNGDAGLVMGGTAEERVDRRVGGGSGGGGCEEQEHWRKGDKALRRLFRWSSAREVA